MLIPAIEYHEPPPADQSECSPRIVGIAPMDHFNNNYLVKSNRFSKRFRNEQHELHSYCQKDVTIDQPETRRSSRAKGSCGPVGRLCPAPFMNCSQRTPTGGGDVFLMPVLGRPERRQPKPMQRRAVTPRLYGSSRKQERRPRADGHLPDQTPEGRGVASPCSQAEIRRGGRFL